MADSRLSQPHAPPPELPEGTGSSRRARWFFAVVLFLLYLAEIIPRLRAADYDEPDVTYLDEITCTVGPAMTLISKPGGRVEFFQKAPGIPHLLVVAFPPYYWLMKNHYGWKSVQDVQLWRAAYYWRSLNIILGGLVVIVIGIIGAHAFNARVGLLAAALCAASPRCTIWFTRLKEEALLTLACAIVMYCAYRVLRDGPLRRRWVLLAGVATGSALAFKYNAAPIVPFFLLALLIPPVAPKTGKSTVSNWLSRPRVMEVVLYLAVSVATFVLWFPQLVFRTKDVLTSMSQFTQFRCLNVAAQKMPSIHELLSVAGRTWNELFFVPASSEQYPIYFSILETVILLVVPIYAILRRRSFLFCLWFFAALTYFSVYYQYLFGDWKQPHYFIAAIVPVLLMLAFGLDLLCETCAIPLARWAEVQPRLVQTSLLALVCLWPLVQSYSASLYSLKVLRGNPQTRQMRRTIVHKIPVGVRVLEHERWMKCHISDALFWKDRMLYRRSEDVGKATVKDLVEQGFDLVCLRYYGPEELLQPSPYCRELAERKVKPLFVQPPVSHYLPRFDFIPVRSGEGESFHLGLYFEEPSGGDYAGVRGIIPPLASQDAENTTQSLVLTARLFNGTKLLPGFVRWEVLAGGKVVWHGPDTTGTAQVSLTLPIQACPGAGILIRTPRTDFRQDAVWGWGGRPSHLKIDGLKVVAADSGKPVPIRWSYAGQNGGPGPARYAMRTDWLNNEKPRALLDTGFEGPQPLVAAWRPYQFIEPITPSQFPQQATCRKMARIEKAVGLGQNGSNALRFIVGHPAKGSATLGIMQPIACRTAPPVRTVRVHYRADGAGANRGKAKLRLAATALGLSGEYVDRAEIKTPLASPSDQWNIIALDVEGAWKSKHTRTDLMDFLEIAIETISGPDAVLNCLIDNVELE